MERVTGMGGVFFRAKDPKALAAWYRDNLGIPLDMEGAADVVVHGVPVPIDIGQLGNGRYFALMAGAGWDAEVMASAVASIASFTRTQPSAAT